MKRAVLVNGVPASGKSTVARQIARATGWPLLTLDTIKEALFAHLGTGDRAHNRRFGQASYQAMFDLVGDFPDGATVIADAWFGFQPVEVLNGHIARAGIGKAAEVWCHAPPQVVAERYRARLARRPSGHLGADYVPELIELSGRAGPAGNWPVVDVDTALTIDIAAVLAEVKAALKA